MLFSEKYLKRDNCTLYVQASSLEKHVRTDIGLQVVSKKLLSALKIWDPLTIFKFPGNIPCCNKRLM